MWRLSRDLGLFAHLALRLDPRVTAFHARYELARWRRRAARSPGAVQAFYVETSSHCAGRCRDCYVPVRDRRAQHRLPDRVLADVVATARRDRPDWVCILGGEPLDPSIRAVNLELVRGAPDLRFLLCTGGYCAVDDAAMRELAVLPNLTMMFSIDGEAATHDRIRGRGSHARMLAAVRAYASARRVVCGASITLRGDTWREATSTPFLAALGAAGCNLLSFDPCFGDSAGDVLTAAQLAAAIERLRAASDPGRVVYVNPFGRLRRDGFEPCSAMSAVAIDYRGNVYASRRGATLGNLSDTPLGEILASPAFHRSRRRVGDGACADDDPRCRLVEDTLSRLGTAAG